MSQRGHTRTRETIGRYEVIRKIATGGMAELLLAKQVGMEGFEKLVAIKRILQHLAFDEEFTTMFRDEARLVAKLSHPGIVQIYDLGKADDSYFIAMEYIPGRNLSSVAKRSKKLGQPLPPEYIARCVAQATEALHYAHTLTDEHGKSFGIVHRDVSPQNIIVSFAGAVKLVDFGIAKAATKIAHTRAGILKGKYAYMSPEQIKGQEIDARSDLFSVGIVLYELLCGKRPFDKENSIQTLKAIVRERPEDCRALNPAIPPSLKAIIDKALEKDREKRFQSALEIQLALEDYVISTRTRVNNLAISEWLEGLFREEIDAHHRKLSVKGVGEVILPDVESEEIDEQGEERQPRTESSSRDDLIAEGAISSPPTAARQPSFEDRSTRLAPPSEAPPPSRSIDDFDSETLFDPHTAAPIPDTSEDAALRPSDPWGDRTDAVPPDSAPAAFGEDVTDGVEAKAPEGLPPEVVSDSPAGEQPPESLDLDIDVEGEAYEEPVVVPTSVPPDDEWYEPTTFDRDHLMAAAEGLEVEGWGQEAQLKGSGEAAPADSSGIEIDLRAGADSAVSRLFEDDDETRRGLPAEVAAAFGMSDADAQSFGEEAPTVSREDDGYSFDGDAATIAVDETMIPPQPQSAIGAIRLSKVKYAMPEGGVLERSMQKQTNFAEGLDEPTTEAPPMDELLSLGSPVYDAPTDEPLPELNLDSVQPEPPDALGPPLSPAEKAIGSSKVPAANISLADVLTNEEPTDASHDGAPAPPPAPSPGPSALRRNIREAFRPASIDPHSGALQPPLAPDGVPPVVPGGYMGFEPSVAPKRGSSQTMVWISALLVLIVAAFAIALVTLSRTTRLTIVSEPPGAVVTLNGTQMKQATPLIVKDIQPGAQIQVQLERPGYYPVNEIVTFPAESQRAKVRFTLERKQEEPLENAQGLSPE